MALWYGRAGTMLLVINNKKQYNSIQIFKCNIYNIEL